MFISKAEKASMKAVLVETNKSMQELKRRIHQLEETMVRLIDVPLATPAEPEPVVSSEPVDYRTLFKPKRKRAPRTQGMQDYLLPYLENLSLHQSVEIVVPEQFEVESLRNSIGYYMCRKHGLRSYCTFVNSDRTMILVERLL